MKIMDRILFVCTGNYYRSRFAEILYNYLAKEKGLDQLAYSRGLEVFEKRNKGTIASETVNYLKQINVPIPPPIAFPVQFEAADCHQARQTILLDKKEHLPMLKKYHPELVDQVAYWEFPDTQFKAHTIVLPQLEQRIRSMFEI